MPRILAAVNAFVAKSRKRAHTACMTATIYSLEQRAAVAERRTRQTIKKVMGYRGLNDTSLAELVRMSRSTVQSYTGGPTQITAKVLAKFAEVLDVDDYVLMMQPDDAMRWVLDHSPNGPHDPDGVGITESGCIADAAPLPRRIPGLAIRGALAA